MDVDEFLEHHGVKGMHWGVHHQRNLELHERVAAGKGSALDKLRARQQVTARDLVKHKGNLQAISAEKAANLRAQKERARTGQSTKLDKVQGVLGATGEDAVRKVLNKPRKDKTVHADVEAFLAHHGVKGMHWGVHRNHDGGGSAPAKGSHAEAKAQKHEAKRKAAIDQVKYHEHASAELTKEAQRHIEMHNDLVKNGLKSKAAEEVLGKGADNLSPGQFFARYGTTKAAALRQVDYQVRSSHNQLQSLANAHAKRAEKLKKKHDLAHGDQIDLESEEELMSLDDALMHFGVKGMKWGVRRGHGTPRAAKPGSSPDAATAHEIKEKARVGKGVHVLSNEELQRVNERLNLEQSYSRLTTTEKGKSDIAKGREFVKTVVGDAKTVVDAVETGKRAVGTASELNDLIKKAKK